MDSDKKYRLAEIPAKPDDYFTDEELAALTPQIVIERCRALKPLIAEKARESEILRRPVDEVWNAIRKTGLFYMMVPRKYKGLEASADEIASAILPIAAGDATTGWVAGFCVMVVRNATNFSVTAQDGAYGNNRYPLSAGVGLPPGKATKVEGGWRVSGHYNWGTCAQQSDVVYAVAMYQGETGPKAAMFMIPMSQVKILDTWNASGLIASGTHDILVEDVFVPDTHADVNMMRNGQGNASKMYDNPLYVAAQSPHLAFTVAIPIVGAARAAVEHYKARLEAHTKRGTAERQGDKQASQIRLAKADTMVTTAEMLMRQTANEARALIGMSEKEQEPHRSRLRARYSYVGQLCRQAVIMVVEATGTSIHYLDHPLQRSFRDVMVMTSHIILDDDVCMEQHGRALLGLPANTTIN